ncbi:MAG: hypothetical protein M3R06_11665 [Chloroflexota bacterium]|nr:hypothetical protein [Chloroflexota bacterium]
MLGANEEGETNGFLQSLARAQPINPTGEAHGVVAIRRGLVENAGLRPRLVQTDSINLNLIGGN